MRRLARVFSLPQPAGDVAPKTGMNADPKGEPKWGDTITHHPMGIKARCVLAKNGWFYIGRHQVDEHVIVGLNRSSVGERKGFACLSPGDGASGM
jgi:hypothetical protein